MIWDIYIIYQTYRGHLRSALGLSPWVTINLLACSESKKHIWREETSYKYKIQHPLPCFTSIWSSREANLIISSWFLKTKSISETQRAGKLDAPRNVGSRNSISLQHSWTICKRVFGEPLIKRTYTADQNSHFVWRSSQAGFFLCGGFTIGLFL
jgi:hypothetical protein